MKKLPLLFLLGACAPPPVIGPPTASITASDIIQFVRPVPGKIVDLSCIPTQLVDVVNFEVERDLRVTIDISGSDEATSCSDIKAVITSGLSGAIDGESVAVAVNGDDTLCEVRRDPNDGLTFVELQLVPPDVCTVGGSFTLLDFQFPNLSTVTFEYVVLPD